MSTNGGSSFPSDPSPENGRILLKVVPKSVLVVDDDAAIRGMVRSVLLRHGYVVDEAVGGQDAIARIERQQYDVLLLDLMMSDGNGEDVLDALRVLHPDRKCVVIISAAAPAKLNVVDTPNIAAKLRKPFDIDVLLAAVRDCVEPAAT